MAIEFNWVVIVISVILLFYVLYQEFKRIKKHWRAVRLLASLLMIVCLALMALPLHHQKTVKGIQNEIVFITPGFESDSLLDVKGTQFYSNQTLNKELRTKATFIADLSYYLSEHPSINKINVYGDGLSTDDLKKLKGHQLEFHPSKANGIIACNWTDKVTEGENVWIQGTYANNTSEVLSLKLLGYGTTLDSLKIPAKSSTSFSLSHQIKQKGKALLQLVALNGKDTIAKELVPIQSEAKNLVKALMLTATPSFETKFLKQWLYENNYPLAVRSEISKDKYSIDFLNTKVVNLNQVQPSLLKNEDILIIDQTSYENINSAERNAINNAVNQGMGLLILAENEKSSNLLLKQIGLNKLPTQKTLDLTITNTPSKLFSLPASQELFITKHQNQQTLIEDQKQHSLAIQQLYGAGRIAITTLNNSHEWMLLGKSKDYAAYWSALISAVARKQNSNLSLRLLQQIPTFGQKLSFHITASDAMTPKVQLGTQQLRTKQNIVFPNTWETSTWLSKKGWNTLSINQNAFHFYVFRNEDWKAMKVVSLQKANLDYIQKQSKKIIQNEETIGYEEREVSKWYFLIGFVFAVGFLWFENRIYNRI